MPECLSARRGPSGACPPTNSGVCGLHFGVQGSQFAAYIVHSVVWAKEIQDDSEVPFHFLQLLLRQAVNFSELKSLVVGEPRGKRCHSIS